MVQGVNTLGSVIIVPVETFSLINYLDVPRCPHCGIARPHLPQAIKPFNIKGTGGDRWWSVYVCSVCGGAVVAASSYRQDGPVTEYYPRGRGPFSTTIPERARDYLLQARESLAQPAASIMVCASAVDALLKDKGFKEGNLHDRINKAATNHLITPDMAKWAHQVRLDANEQRHADENVPMPTQQDAERSLGFAAALAEVLYVIPARVTKGIEESKPPTAAPTAAPSTIKVKPK